MRGLPIVSKILLVSTVVVGFGEPTAADESRETIRSRALAGPLKNIQHILFAVRHTYDDPHWYANIGYFCDDENHKAYAGNGQPDVGKLCLLNPHTGNVSVLVDAKGGSIRDPHIHYDANKALFSYRKAGEDYYHLYEINLDGSGLVQLTSGDFDDYEPAYLPDGGIVFVSTRCQCWVNCWKTQVGVLHRCDADGSNILRISHNAEHDNTPSVLPDGRILYTRWEYVDRSQVEFHHLWTMNPDGTGEMVYYGNMRPGIVMIDAQPIPNSRKVLVNFSPGHGVKDHQGRVAIVSQVAGPDTDPQACLVQKGGPLIKDPFPVNSECFIVARGNEICVMDQTGAMERLLQWDGPGQIHEPRPVIPRLRERLIPSRHLRDERVGRFVLANVYEGRNLQGVQPGDIKQLLVLELLPKQVNFSGGPDLVSWLGTFSLERVLGTVPVEDDGSAYFEVPAGRPVFFVALDEDQQSVKRMHSFVSVMPGETTGCVGCHETRSTTPSHQQHGNLAALQRPPSPIQPFSGFPDVLDFNRDIQPILDRHCVECHCYEHRDGQVVLNGDLGPQWSHSYFQLLAHLQVADGRNGLGNYQPRSIGSAASPLLDKLAGGHYDVKASDDEWRTVWLWIESGAPYAGSYAGLRNAEDQSIDFGAAGRIFGAANSILRKRCIECHDLNQRDNPAGKPLPFSPNMTANSRGLPRRTGIHERVVLENDPLARYGYHILLNFTRPEYSPLLLGPLAKDAGGWGTCPNVFEDKNDPEYIQLLAILQKGKEQVDQRPRYGTPGFRPNRQYIRELKKYGVLDPDFDPQASSLDIFDADQKYWSTFWYAPPQE
jgi:hypothetical protein